MTPVFSEVYSHLSTFPTENATGADSQESPCYGQQRNPGAANLGRPNWSWWQAVKEWWS